MFGIPYLVSPAEAEAQCAQLDFSKLTDGSITDDSDIFLFGGNRVYKNIFNQNKYAEVYLADDLNKKLCKFYNLFSSVNQCHYSNNFSFFVDIFLKLIK